MEWLVRMDYRTDASGWSSPTGAVADIAADDRRVTDPERSFVTDSFWGGNSPFLSDFLRSPRCNADKSNPQCAERRIF